MNENSQRCLVCNSSSSEIPLLALNYRDTIYYICPQHFPLLIHKPERLVGILPGAEHMLPHDHED